MKAWQGVLITFAGAALALYAYTGPRVYHIAWLGALLLGLGTAGAGAWWTGRAQGRTRTPQDRANRRKRE